MLEVDFGFGFSVPHLPALGNRTRGDLLLVVDQGVPRT
jgi:hypothetical protein